MMQSESFLNLAQTDQTYLAERELSAFIAAVAKSFGEDQARMSAEDWFEELELMDSPPCSTWQGWRAITIAASARLANRLNVALHRYGSPAAPIDSEVSPTLSSKCFDSTLLS